MDGYRLRPRRPVQNLDLIELGKAVSGNHIISRYPQDRIQPDIVYYNMVPRVVPLAEVNRLSPCSWRCLVALASPWMKICRGGRSTIASSAALGGVLIDPVTLKHAIFE